VVVVVVVVVGVVEVVGVVVPLDSSVPSGPPSSLSLPGRPKRLSSPPSPKILSLSSPPARWSSPAVPGGASRSADAVPATAASASSARLDLDEGNG
jgi:hypothetical protein